MNRSKSSNVGKDLTKVIQKNTMIEPRHRHEHIFSAEDFGKPTFKAYGSMTPTKQPICNTQNSRSKVEQLIRKYVKIIERLKTQCRYHEYVMMLEKQKYEQYYDQMVSIILDQKIAGSRAIEEQTESIKNLFELKIGCLTNKVVQLQGKNLQSIQKQTAQLTSQNYIELNMFCIKTIDLGNFKQEIDKYFIKQYPSFSEQSSLVQEQHRKSSHSSFSSLNNNSASETLDEHDISIQANLNQNQGSLDSQNQIELACDEDFSLLSESIQKRSKARIYGVGEVDVICQEDESNESSIIAEGSLD